MNEPRNRDALWKVECRPYGTRMLFDVYPALKGGATMFRAYGAGIWDFEHSCLPAASVLELARVAENELLAANC